MTEYPAIGLDYTAAVHQTAGIGRYAREITADLVDHHHADWRLFVADGKHADLPVQPPGVTVAPSRWSERTHNRIWHRLRLPLVVETWTGPLDLYHALDFFLPPTRRQTRTVVTIHDLSYEHFPEQTMPGMLDFLRTHVPRSVAVADHVIAVSESTRDDLLSLYGVDPARVTVIPHGVRPRFHANQDPAEQAAIRAKYRLPGDIPLILTVGTTQPRKNHLRLVRALPALNQQDAVLVIAGGRGWYYNDVFQEVERLGLRDRVVFTSYVDEADLPALYRAADVFAYPAIYEGFGLPVLEAMACGTPVLASETSSLPEVVGEDGLCGILVNPHHVDAIADGLNRMLDDPGRRAELSRNGIARAGEFTWARAADAVWDVYQTLLV